MQKVPELTLEGIKQYFIVVGKEEEKLEGLIKLYHSLGNLKISTPTLTTLLEISQCIAYCNKEKSAEELKMKLTEKQFLVTVTVIII